MALDGVKLISSLDNRAASPGSQVEKSAKDFESVLLSKVFDEMKNTIGKWTEEEDVAADQVKGLFWLFLARDVGDKGGLGLWKDLSRFFTDMQKPNSPQQSLDENL